MCKSASALKDAAWLSECIRLWVSWLCEMLPPLAVSVFYRDGMVALVIFQALVSFLGGDRNRSYSGPLRRLEGPGVSFLLITYSQQCNCLARHLGMDGFQHISKSLLENMVLQLPAQDPSNQHDQHAEAASIFLHSVISTSGKQLLTTQLHAYFHNKLLL